MRTFAFLKSTIRKHEGHRARGPFSMGAFAVEPLELRDCPAIVFSGFLENSPTDPVPLLGTAPQILATSANFDPNGFQSQSSPVNGNDTTTSFLLFNVNATGNSFINNIAFSLGGDATVIGGPGSFAAAGISANLFIRVTQVNGSTPVNVTTAVPIVFNPNSGQFSLANGGNQVARIFNGSGQINVANLLAANNVSGNATRVEVNVTTLLNTDASSQGSSFIQVKTGRAEVTEGTNPTGSIGRIIYRDLDCDGVQDENEGGIEGVRVFLDSAGANGIFGDSDDGPTQSKITGTDGVYSFDQLPAGVYRVRVDTTSAALANLKNTGDPDSTKDSTFVLTTSAPNNLNRTDANFGYADVRGTIGDRVWLDQNNNGQQDNNEPGIVGVTVELRSAGVNGLFGDNDDVVRTVVTTANGAYSFTNVDPGTYRVSVLTNTLPGLGFFPTFDKDGGNNSSTQVVLADCQTINDIDFGFNRFVGTIGDTIYRDDNANGVQDGSEQGIVGVTVNLLYAGPNGIFGDSDDVTFSQVTGANGKYLFTDLFIGNYRVTVDTTTGGLSTLTNTGDPDAVKDSRSQLTLTQNALNNLDQDFGYVAANGQIGDTIYRDNNANGTQDGTEPGIVGVTVRLTYAGADGNFGTADDVTSSQVTGPNGKYLFNNLLPGKYRVVVDTTSAPLVGLINTGDPDSTKDSRSELTLVSPNAMVNLNQDFGYVDATSQSQAVLSGAVYVDTNNNGIIDNNEVGIGGITISLLNASTNQVIRTTQTDGAGLYSFTGLSAGTYRILEGATPGYLDGRDTAGTFGASVDNDQFNAIVLPTNQIGVGYNFGERGLAPQAVTKRSFLASSNALRGTTVLSGLQNQFGTGPSSQSIVQAALNPAPARNQVFSINDFGQAFGVGTPGQLQRSRPANGTAGVNGGIVQKTTPLLDEALLADAHDEALEEFV